MCAQEKIKSAAGFDARWQWLVDEHGDKFTGLLRARLPMHGVCAVIFGNFLGW